MAAGPRTRFVAEIEGDTLRTLIEGETLEIDAGEPEGAIVLARRSVEGRASILRRLAEPGTALAELHRLAARTGIDVAFPESVMHEVERWEARPEIDDPSLDDRTALPFVTIDGPLSRDLDQAIFVDRLEGGGWRVQYAIADASHFVRRGSALFAEALRRGASYYLPGLSIPMLPRALSEGILSLNPDGPRRALVFEMDLDARGRSIGTRWIRARIRSRAKLAFADVQALHDDRARSPLAGAPFEESLMLLREVGRARLREATERDVVRYRRREVDVHLDGVRGERFVVLDSARHEVELWNEQVSLLCNAEGARLLKDSGAPFVQPIYRIHPPPHPDRVESLRATIEAIVEAHHLPRIPWSWDQERASLAVYVAELPHDGPHARVARAIQRQAILVNVRSTYATEPAAHFGVGFDPYGRFSAPMREIVGVYLHAEAVQLLEGRASSEEESALREQVVQAGNRARELQRRINDLVNRRVIDRLFAPDLALPPSDRRVWHGTVMGLDSGKIHVQLDSPSIDVKIYLRDLAPRSARANGNDTRGPFLLDPLGVVLRDVATGKVFTKLGDPIALRVAGRDEQRDRWALEPLR